jgi:hypothetical protein
MENKVRVGCKGIEGREATEKQGEKREKVHGFYEDTAPQNEKSKSATFPLF